MAREHRVRSYRQRDQNRIDGHALSARPWEHDGVDSAGDHGEPTSHDVVLETIDCGGPPTPKPERSGGLLRREDRVRSEPVPRGDFIYHVDVGRLITSSVFRYQVSFVLQPGVDLSAETLAAGQFAWLVPAPVQTVEPSGE